MKSVVTGTARTLLFGSVMCVVTLVGACAASPDNGERGARTRGNLNAGIQALEARDFEMAVRQLEIAIVADPKNPDGYFRLGQSHRGLGDFRRALKYIRLALEIEPNHLPAWRERGETQLDAGEAEAARETLEKLGQKCDRVCPEYQSLKRQVDATPAKSGG